MRGYVYLLTVGLSGLLASPLAGSVIYNNLTPNNSMAAASRPTATEIETADDFTLKSTALINSASFTGLFVGSGPFNVSQVVVEIYQVFPLSSDTVRTPNVVTRANSPSDVAFASKDSGGSELTFGTTLLNANFTALNSVTPGGIHPKPGQTTGGNGPLIGQEVQFDVNFTTPFSLPADHYFFVPQVAVTGGEFYWLSADRPITGVGGTTIITPDLQAWTRDANLDPDWSRIGTDIVGGQTPPTFNMAFSLDGTLTPEPGTMFVGLAGLVLLGIRRRFV